MENILQITFESVSWPVKTKIGTNSNSENLPTKKELLLFLVEYRKAAELCQEQYCRLFVNLFFCSLSDMRDGIQYFTNREVCRKEKCDDLTCRVLKLLYSYESRFLPLVAKVCYQRVGSSIMQNCRISSLRNCKKHPITYSSYTEQYLILLKKRKLFSIDEPSLTYNIDSYFPFNSKEDDGGTHEEK